MLTDRYHEHGFCLLPRFFDAEELEPIRDVLIHFHQSWLVDNKAFYQYEAINSAYITGSRYLNDDQRCCLFQLIGSHKLAQIIEEIILQQAAFMNSQLFFDPNNTNQQNYWHRDPQYDLSLEAHQQSLLKDEILHFRISMKPERGIELVPGTHRRWDTELELQTRFEKSGRSKSDPLPNTKRIALDYGDLLVFSGNMIHRGLYGLDRFSFDILICNADPKLLQFAEHGCLPTTTMLKSIEAPKIFITTQQIIDNL